jgi:hypothetical protein
MYVLKIQNEGYSTNDISYFEGTPSVVLIKGRPDILATRVGKRVKFEVWWEDILWLDGFGEVVLEKDHIDIKGNGINCHQDTLPFIRKMLNL